MISALFGLLGAGSQPIASFVMRVSLPGLKQCETSAQFGRFTLAFAPHLQTDFISVMDRIGTALRRDFALYIVLARGSFAEDDEFRAAYRIGN